MQKWLKIVTIIVFIVVDIIGAILAGVSIGGGTQVKKLYTEIGTLFKHSSILINCTFILHSACDHFIQ